MVDLSYDFIKDIFAGLGKGDSFQWFNYSYKFLAASFFLLTIYTNMITSRFEWGEPKLPFDQGKFFNVIIIIVLIASYDYILILLDSLLSPLDAQVNKYNSVQHLLFKEEVIAPEEDLSAMATLKKAASQVLEFMTRPFALFIKMFYIVFWFLDNLVYAVFLIERFFFLTVLRLLGPIVFVMAIFEKFRDLLYKWIKLYVAVYLLILPFFVVIYVTNEIYRQLSLQVDDVAYLDFLPNIKYQTYAVLVGLSFFIKLRLFKKSTEIVYKIFT